MADAHDHIRIGDWRLVLEASAFTYPCQPESEGSLIGNHHDPGRTSREGTFQVDPLDASIPLGPSVDVSHDFEYRFRTGGSLQAVLVGPHETNLQ